MTTQLYRTRAIWNAMKSRCYSRRNKSFPAYGGRGIVVCDRWLESFENFLADMGCKPDGYSLDRVNNDGNYEPGNCRWVTRVVQQNNMRSNVRVEFRSRIQTVSQWARELQMPFITLSSRLRRGWPVESALTEPLCPGKRPHFLN